ncbi:ephrin type-B receptor 4 isoform X2 [Nematostella vectensis]|uniref:ephrin type-B receptor 4 isoform X2 n=1 Tax=Nematostella vectensis TaxID=45351 RepID=UPI002077013E|nr:ephrin type-B receptor 4 isoform X2 [Nematostella vectensis]
MNHRVLFMDGSHILLILLIISSIAAEEELLFRRQYTDLNWTWLTTFRFADGAGWRRDSSTQEYTTCDLQQTLTNSTDSWLISDYIPLQPAVAVTLWLTFTVRECPSSLPHCRQHFAVYTRHSAGQISEGVSKVDIQSGNFTLIGNATASAVWAPGQPRVHNSVSMTFPAGNAGVYIGFQDVGACVAVREVRMTYQYCSEVVASDGAVFNRTVAPLPGTVAQVSGICQGMTQPFSNSSTHAQCLSDGRWNISAEVTCQCQAGYQPVSRLCEACPSGMFKAESGNTPCKQCPDNSSPNDTRDACVCNPGYYRMLSEPRDGKCTTTPSAPRDLISVSIQPDTLLLSWKPPLEDGGRSDLTYIITCRRCHNGNDSDVCDLDCERSIAFTPIANQSVYTHVTISGLSPGSRYVLRVSSRNGVTSFADGSAIRFIEVNVTLPIREALKVRTTYVMGNMAVLSWSSLNVTLLSTVCKKCDTMDYDCVTCNATCGDTFMIKAKDSVLIATGLEEKTKYHLAFEVIETQSNRSSNATVCVTTADRVNGEGDSKPKGAGEANKENIVTTSSILVLALSSGLLLCSGIMLIVTLHLRRRWYKRAKDHREPESQDGESYGVENILYMEERYMNSKPENDARNATATNVRLKRQQNNNEHPS